MTKFCYQNIERYQFECKRDNICKYMINAMY